MEHIAFESDEKKKPSPKDNAYTGRSEDERSLARSLCAAVRSHACMHATVVMAWFFVLRSHGPKCCNCDLFLSMVSLIEYHVECMQAQEFRRELLYFARNKLKPDVQVCDRGVVVTMKRKHLP